MAKVGDGLESGERESAASRRENTARRHTVDVFFLCVDLRVPRVSEEKTKRYDDVRREKKKKRLTVMFRELSPCLW